MSEQKKDPITDIIDSIVNDYKEAINYRRNKNKKSQDDFKITIPERTAKYIYDFFKLSNKKFLKFGVPLILGGIYTTFNHFNIADLIIKTLDFKIKLNYSFQIILVNLILTSIVVFIYWLIYKSSEANLESYFKKKFKITDFIIKEHQLPIFIKYIKHKESKDIDYHFRTVLPLDHWIKNKNILEMIFPDNIKKIQHYNNQRNIVVIKTNKEKVDYYVECRDISNAIDKRLEYGFNFFNIFVEVVEVKEKQYQTIIEFNSKTDRTKLLALKEDLKHRTNISNLQLQANNNTDYKAVISKKINTIDYNKLLEEVELNQDNNILIGIDKSSNIHTLNIFKMTHVVVGGSSGNGKSNVVNGILTSLYYSNLNNVVYCLIDPKKAELKKYRDINNTFYAGKNEDILSMLKALEDELTRREDIIDNEKFIKDIEQYNSKFKNNQMPYIIVVIEEIADLMSKTSDNKDFFKEFNRITQRIVQAGRSNGFRAFLCTQQPKADILNTTIKLNCITRLAFGTDTTGNSRLILDNDKAFGLQKGELILQHGGKDIFVKAPLVEENLEKLEILITEIENRYENANNDIVKQTIQSIQTSINKHGSTVQLEDNNHTNHTNNYTVLVGDKSNTENTSINLVGGNFSYAVESTADLLDYYLKVVDESGRLPSVANTAKNTNKSTTTIQKLRKELIENGDIYINGQNAYLKKKSKEA